MQHWGDCQKAKSQWGRLLFHKPGCGTPSHTPQLDANADAPQKLWVVAQVHHLTRQAKAKKILTFTNARDEDLVVFYTAIKQDEDDVNLAHAHDELVGVYGANKDDKSNEDYAPEQRNGEDLEDKEDDDSEDDDSNRDDSNGGDTP